MTLGLEPAWPLRVAELLPRPKPKGPLAAVHAVRRGPATGDLHGVDATGATLLELRGVQLQPAAAPTARRPGATPGATGPDAGPGPEQYLVALIARILRLDLAEVDREASLDGLGLDSVLGQELRAAVRQDLGVRLSERLLRSGLSVAELAGRLNDRLERMEQSR